MSRTSKTSMTTKKGEMSETSNTTKKSKARDKTFCYFLTLFVSIGNDMICFFLKHYVR